MFFWLLLACRQTVSPPYDDPVENPSKDWENLINNASLSGGVNYELIQANQEILDNYISYIAYHGPNTDQMRIRHEDKKIAFFMNAYNALVIYSVLEHQPLGSVHDLKTGLFASEGRGFFVNQLFRVDGSWMSLNHIAIERLLAMFQTPLIHMGLNKGSHGSPKLHYWIKYKVDTQLESALKKYLKTDHGAQQTKQGWAVNELFFTYEDDFIDWSTASNLCEFLEPYASSSFQDWLEANFTLCPLEMIPHDWTLNQAPIKE